MIARTAVTKDKRETGAYVSIRSYFVRSLNLLMTSLALYLVSPFLSYFRLSTHLESITFSLFLVDVGLGLSTSVQTAAAFSFFGSYTMLQSRFRIVIEVKLVSYRLIFLILPKILTRFYPDFWSIFE